MSGQKESRPGADTPRRQSGTGDKATLSASHDTRNEAELQEGSHTLGWIGCEIDSVATELRQVETALTWLWGNLEEERPVAEKGNSYPDPLKGGVFAARARGYLEQMSLFMECLGQRLDALDALAQRVMDMSRTEKEKNTV